MLAVPIGAPFRLPKRRLAGVGITPIYFQLTLNFAVCTLNFTPRQDSRSPVRMR